MLRMNDANWDFYRCWCAPKCSIPKQIFAKISNTFTNNNTKFVFFCFFWQTKSTCRLRYISHFQIIQIRLTTLELRLDDSSVFFSSSYNPMKLVSFSFCGLIFFLVSFYRIAKQHREFEMKSRNKSYKKKSHFQRTTPSMKREKKNTPVQLNWFLLIWSVTVSAFCIDSTNANHILFFSQCFQSEH